MNATDLFEVESKPAKKKGFTHDSVDNLSVEWYTPAWGVDSVESLFNMREKGHLVINK